MIKRPSSIFNLTAFMLTCFVSAAGHAQSRGGDTTYGECSPNLAHNSGSVVINCKGLDPSVALQLSELVRDISLLNKKTATEKTQRQMIELLRSVRATVQEALSRPSVQVNAPVTQISTGSCSPNVIGNNNVNVCGPQELKVDDVQQRDLTERLAQLPPELKKTDIQVLLEVTDHATSTAGITLVNALKAAGLRIDLETAYMMGTPPDNYGGISFINILPTNEGLANALGLYLNQTGIVSGPVPAFKPETTAQGSKLIVVIRKP